MALVGDPAHDSSEPLLITLPVRRTAKLSVSQQPECADFFPAIRAVHLGTLGTIGVIITGTRLDVAVNIGNALS